MRKANTRSKRAVSLVQALKTGDIGRASELKIRGSRIYPNNNVTALHSVWLGKCPDHIYSRQLDPDRLNTVAAFAQVEAECGPFYEGAQLSVGPRPAGWATAAREERILSWTDQGFGLVGDQLVDIDERFITTKPLTKFRATLISGPFTAEVLPPSQARRESQWQDLLRRQGEVPIDLWRRLFLAYQVAHRDLDWTQDYGLARELTETIGEAVQAVEGRMAGGEFKLALGAASTNISEKQALLEEAKQLDPGLAGTADLCWLAARCRMEPAESAKTKEMLGQLEAIPSTGRGAKELKAALRLLLRSRQGGRVKFEDLELLAPYLRDPAAP